MSKSRPFGRPEKVDSLRPPIPKLPPELMTMIVHEADADDLLRLRLVSKLFSALTTDLFCRTWFTERSCVMSCRNLQILGDIVSHPILAPYLQSIKFGTPNSSRLSLDRSSPGRLRAEFTQLRQQLASLLGRIMTKLKDRGNSITFCIYDHATADPPFFNSYTRMFREPETPSCLSASHLLDLIISCSRVTGYRLRSIEFDTLVYKNVLFPDSPPSEPAPARPLYEFQDLDLRGAEYLSNYLTVDPDEFKPNVEFCLKPKYKDHSIEIRIIADTGRFEFGTIGRYNFRTAHALFMCLKLSRDYILLRYPRPFSEIYLHDCSASISDLIIFLLRHARSIRKIEMVRVLLNVDGDFDRDAPSSRSVLLGYLRDGFRLESLTLERLECNDREQGLSSYTASSVVVGERRDWKGKTQIRAALDTIINTTIDVPVPAAGLLWHWDTREGEEDDEDDEDEEENEREQEDEESTFSEFDSSHLFDEEMSTLTNTDSGRVLVGERLVRRVQGGI